MYTKPNGFFDVSKRPKTLSKREHEKIQRTQMFLAEQNEKREYLKKHNPSQWKKLKEIAAELQQIILSHWSLEEIT